MEAITSETKTVAEHMRETAEAALPLDMDATYRDALARISKEAKQGGNEIRFESLLPWDAIHAYQRKLRGKGAPSWEVDAKANAVKTTCRVTLRRKLRNDGFDVRNVIEYVGGVRQDPDERVLW